MRETGGGGTVRFLKSSAGETVPLLQSSGLITPVIRIATALYLIAITNRRDAVIPPSRPVDPRTVHRCYVGDSPQPTGRSMEEDSSPSFIRSQARLTKTVKVLHRVAEAHAGSDRRFLPSHTRVSLFCGKPLQEGWVLIRQHSGSLSTGSSAGRLFRRKGGSMYSQAIVRCGMRARRCTKRCPVEKATLKRWAW